MTGEVAQPANNGPESRPGGIKAAFYRAVGNLARRQKPGRLGNTASLPAMEIPNPTHAILDILLAQRYAQGANNQAISLHQDQQAIPGIRRDELVAATVSPEGDRLYQLTTGPFQTGGHIGVEAGRVTLVGNADEPLSLHLGDDGITVDNVAIRTTFITSAAGVTAPTTVIEVNLPTETGMIPLPGYRMLTVHRDGQTQAERYVPGGAISGLVPVENYSDADVETFMLALSGQVKDTIEMHGQVDRAVY